MAKSKTSVRRIKSVTFTTPGGYSVWIDSGRIAINPTMNVSGAIAQESGITCPDGHFTVRVPAQSLNRFYNERTRVFDFVGLMQAWRNAKFPASMKP